MTQTPLEQPRTTSQEISNLVDVSARTASETPRAFCDELYTDITQRTSQVVARVGEGAVIGVAGTLLLKIPDLAPAVMAAGLAYTGYQAWTAGSDFVGRATKADTVAQKEAVAHTSAHQLGGTLSAFAESAPGMIGGGYAISKYLGAPPLYTRIGDAVDRNVLSPIRGTSVYRAASDVYAFRGPGSVRLSSSLVNQEGEFDALSASKILAQRHPWQGVETGSSLDLGKLRISRAVSGQDDVIGTLPGAARENVVPFHIHGPEAPVGAYPSRFDMGATKDLGILQQGQTTTYYVGEARQYAPLAKAGNGEYFSPSMRAVIVDNQNGLAQRLTGQWLHGKGWQLDAPVNLDFAQTLKTIGQIKATNPWLSLSGIAAKTGG